MSLSRRRFTQEFNLSAVERLQQGASAAQVSRAFEINPMQQTTVAGHQKPANGQQCLN